MTFPPQNRRFLQSLFLFSAALLIVLERCHTYREPLERDITTYAVIGNELLKGRLLYTDLWDHKPPAIHVTYALVEALTGLGPLSIFILTLFSSLALLAVLYRGGKSFGGSGGFWAALLWAVVSGDLYLQANQPNTEAFINVFQAWVFVLWLEARPGALEARRFTLIGLFLSLASFYKPFAVVEGLALAAASVFLQASGRGGFKRAFLQAALVFFWVGAAWAALMGYFFLQNRWDDFKDAVFTYNAYYDGYLRAFLSSKVSLADFKVYDLDPSRILWLLPLCFLGFLAAFFQGREKQDQRPWLFWIAFLLAALIEIYATGRIYPHYFQLLLPPVVLGGAGGVAWLGERLEKKHGSPRWVPGALALAALLLYEAPFYRLPPELWTKKKYTDGAFFVETYQRADEIRQLLKPGETFYEWGNETELYFVSQCSPPSGVFYNYPLCENPLADRYSWRVVRDLERAKPELFIVCMIDTERISLTNPVLDWARENYRRFPGNPSHGSLLFLALRGGNLEKRLAGRGDASQPLGKAGVRPSN